MPELTVQSYFPSQLSVRNFNVSRNYTIYVYMFYHRMPIPCKYWTRLGPNQLFIVRDLIVFQNLEDIWLINWGVVIRERWWWRWLAVAQGSWSMSLPRTQVNWTQLNWNMKRLLVEHLILCTAVELTVLWCLGCRSDKWNYTDKTLILAFLNFWALDFTALIMFLYPLCIRIGCLPLHCVGASRRITESVGETDFLLLFQVTGPGAAVTGEILCSPSPGVDGACAVWSALGAGRGCSMLGHNAGMAHVEAEMREHVRLLSGTAHGQPEGRIRRLYLPESKKPVLSIYKLCYLQ